MIIVSDTAPLNYLVLIDQSHLLHDLYGCIAIAEAVRNEMQRADTPEKVRDFVNNPPGWLEVSCRTGARPHFELRGRRA